jgi:hypothetical protein
MDRARHRLNRRWRSDRLLWRGEASGHRHMSRPAFRGLLRLHRLRAPVLRLGAIELTWDRLWLSRSGLGLWLWLLGPLRLLLWLRLNLLRCLRLLVLLRGLLARSSAVLGFAQSRKLAGKDRLFIARRYLLRVKRNVELDAGLAAAILRVLTGIKCGQQLLDQRIRNL